MFSVYWDRNKTVKKFCLRYVLRVWKGGSGLRSSSPGRSGGGAGKGRRPCNYVSGIWISASKRRCKMLIGGDDFSNDVITLGTCFFNVCSHSHSFSLRADWRKSDSSVDGEPQGNWKWNFTLQALLPYRPAAREPLRACSQTSPGGRREKLISHSRSFFKTIPHLAHLPSLSRAKIWANPAFRVADPTYDWNPGSKFHCQTWNPVAGIRNPRRGMQNPRLSWIPLLGVKLLVKGKITAFCQIS